MHIPRSLGRYITFDGIDGSGKSTQMRTLASHLRNVGYEVAETKEPGSHLVTFNVRDFLLGDKKVDPLALELLFQADRAAHTKVVAELQQTYPDWFILADRSYLSGVAYSMANGFTKEDLAPILNLTVKATPDLAIYVKTPVDVAMQRLDPTKRTREEAKGTVFMQKVADNFDAIFPSGEVMNLPKPKRTLVVNGTEPIDIIAQKILAVVGLLL